MEEILRKIAMEKIRKHIFFSGIVQGVGFRYRAYHIAQMLGLIGWVRNTWDDRVEMEVQGSRADIEQMVQMLYQQRFIQIDNIEMNAMPVEPESSFRIR